MRLNAQTVLTIGVAAIAGYFLWKRWKDMQRAAAHPISVSANPLVPIGVDVNALANVGRGSVTVSIPGTNFSATSSQ